MDLCVWCDAFKSCMTASLRKNNESGGLPLIPELSDKNYFVATVYMCLLPEHLLNTDIDALESHRSVTTITANSNPLKGPRPATSELSNNTSEV